MNINESQDAFDERVKELSESANLILTELGKRLVGQQQVARRLLMAMIANGHVLLEGLPGLAKTTAIKSLSEVTALSFKRIQFTPDLLPADVIGTQIYDPHKASFSVKRGPIFANLVLADEINRAPAKVQSALLEAMQEKQITIGDDTFVLEEPFLVMATQNPVDQEGTYPLPEAQMDRFLFKVKVGYGSPEDELEIIKRGAIGSKTHLEKVADARLLSQMAEAARGIYASDKVRAYMVHLVFASREPERYDLADMKPLIAYGASPRASLSLDHASRVNALMEGRSFITPQDVKDVAMDVLRHRIHLSFEAEAEDITSEQIIKRLLDSIDVP